jgi:hypothetical protein
MKILSGTERRVLSFAWDVYHHSIGVEETIRRDQQAEARRQAAELTSSSRRAVNLKVSQRYLEARGKLCMAHEIIGYRVELPKKACLSSSKLTSNLGHPVVRCNCISIPFEYIWMDWVAFDVWLQACCQTTRQQTSTELYQLESFPLLVPIFQLPPYPLPYRPLLYFFILYSTSFFFHL